MAGKTKLTKAAKEQVIASLSAGADMALAAHAVGVTRAALYKAGGVDPVFRERMDEARSRADDAIVAKLFRKALGGDTTAMIFWLKNRRSTEWRDKGQEQTMNILLASAEWNDLKGRLTAALERHDEACGEGHPSAAEAVLAALAPNPNTIDVHRV